MFEDGGKFDDDDDQNINKLLGERVHMNQAKEPDNIIWENLYVRGWSFIFRVIIVVLVTLAILLAFFVGSIAMNGTTTKLELEYPKINCDLIHKEYSLEEV